MSKLAIIRAAVKVETGESRTEKSRKEQHVVSLREGAPVALDGVSPVIIIQVVEPEREAAYLLRAAEHLLPLNREAPGVVLLDESGVVLGVAPRPELERAVLQRLRGDYAALTRSLGLRSAYTEPAGDQETPFVYWECPACKHRYVPPKGREDDPPGLCPKAHDPAVQMERRVHSGA